MKDNTFIDKKNWVVTKSNDLIEATYKLTLQQQRILLIMASKIQPTDDELAEYRFRARDFMDVIGVKKGTGFYTYLKQVINGLQSTVLTVHKNGVQQNYNWVITSIYEEDSGYVTLQFHPKLRHFFLHLKEKFTTYRLENVLLLSSTYSIRMYELLKRYEFRKKRTFTLEELRTFLAIEPQKYKQYGHFKNKVLETAINEINSKTDLTCTYKELKTGRKVTSIEFHLTKDKNCQENLPVLKSLSNSSEEPEVKKVHENLLSCGLNAQEIQNLLSVHDIEYLIHNILYVNEKAKEGKVTKIAPYMRKAFKENYANYNTSPSAKKKITRKEKLPSWFTDKDKNDIQVYDRDFEEEKAALEKILKERKKIKPEEI